MSKLYILIALPAAGKSTWAEKFCNRYDNTVHISSDAIREEVFGSAEDQAHNAEVFEIMRKRTRETLSAGGNVIYDATNLNRKRRMGFIREMKKLADEIIGVVFAVPFEICCERNQRRERTVPYSAMERMYKSFQPPSTAEGFDRIEIVRDNHTINLEAELDAAIRISHDNPHHDLTIGEHMMEACNYIEWQKNFLASFAVRYHDIGKPFCKVFHNTKGVPTEIAHYYNHENVGAYMALCGDLYNDVSEKDVLYITNLTANHMVFYAGEGAMEKVKKLYGEAFWKDLCLLHEADEYGHTDHN